jgi:hypothetical protein
VVFQKSCTKAMSIPCRFSMVAAFHAGKAASFALIREIDVSCPTGRLRTASFGRYAAAAERHLTGALPTKLGQRPRSTWPNSVPRRLPPAAGISANGGSTAAIGLKSVIASNGRPPVLAMSEPAECRMGRWIVDRHKAAQVGLVERPSRNYYRNQIRSKTGGKL